MCNTFQMTEQEATYSPRIPKRENLNIRLKRSTKAQIQEVAKARGVPISEVLREAVDAYLCAVEIQRKRREGLQ
jgi:hypothetical protein